MEDCFNEIKTLFYINLGIFILQLMWYFALSSWEKLIKEQTKNLRR